LLTGLLEVSSDSKTTCGALEYKRWSDSGSLFLLPS
jgi:hypothetical protein